MSKALKLFSCVAAVMAVGLTGRAQFYTIAPGGPSGYLSDTVYVPGGPPPLFGAGAAPAFPGPPPPNPPGFYIVDALSSGADAGDFYLFSVRFGAMGLPGSPVAFEVGVGTAPSQVFPGPPAPGSVPPEAEGDIFPLAGPAFGLVGFSPPPVFAPVPADEFLPLGLNVGGGAPGDDLNGLTHRGPGAFGFYYSLAAGGLGGSGAMPADILNTSGLWAPAAALGLDGFGPGTDDIDALLVQDLSMPGIFEPGIDFVAFSLAPGSLTLGIAGPGYAPGGGDLLVPDGPDPDLLPDIFVPAPAFGLLPMDNLDAVDVVPEPSAAVLLLAAFALIVLRRAAARCMV